MLGSPRLDARSTRQLILFRQRDSPQAAEGFTPQYRLLAGCQVPADRSRWLRRIVSQPDDRLGTNGDSGALRSSASLVKISNRAAAAGSGTSVRTASIATASSLPVDKPAQAIERQGRVVGPQHSQAVLEHRGGCSGIVQESGDVVFAGNFVSGTARLAVESFQGRQRGLEQIPRGRARGQPRQQLRAKLLEPMLADPLDRREMDERIGISQKSRQERPGFRPTRIAQDQQQAQPPAGREILCRRRARSARRS